MDKTLAPKSQKRLFLAWSLTFIATVLLLSTSGIWVYTVLFPPLQTHSIIHGPEITRPHIPNASDAAGKYFQSFLQRDYQTMWSMLQPQTQSIWSRQNVYASYWQSRFQGYTIAGYTLGEEIPLSSWTNPENMHQYKQVTEIPVTLQIFPTDATRHAAKGLEIINPTILNPGKLYRNIPMYLSKDAHAHWQILNGGPIDLEAPIIPPLHPTPHQVKVPILMYHHISDTPTNDALSKSLTVTTKMFSQQLAYLKAHHAHSITFNQLFDALYYNGPLPTNSVIITFDDGYNDAYNNAYPILRKYGFGGMFYIIAGKVGWKGQAIWEQIQAMQLGGMQIGSHTVNHVDIGDTYLNSPANARKELEDSRTILQHHLKIPIQQFCYPSGEPFRHGSLALRQEIIALLTQVGYVGSTTDPGETGITQDSLHPQELLRIRVDGRDALDTFADSIPW
ncbi:polysaccharide deacetylase family protein [Ktedonospora formicarum]|uniref:NodB homology domain-containing protein n=1 Tax=Ktedonospora formicarum TaxID=2778364 RepID=A0A8J3I1X2_9CHLR|nr:polysaccharide deacetylase family protein [Ktedonospora formicarum]GHO43404.1 hypothetical protein KSX_15670 [Ktedonospora formicarum]